MNLESLVSRIRNIAVLGATSLTALAVMAAPASAATTTIRSGAVDGPAYAGAVAASNLGNLTVKSALGDTTCTTSTMAGTIDADGTNLSVSGSSFAGCTGALGSVTVTATNLPWTGGSVVYSPVAGGEDGTITLANFRVSATVAGLTCIYGGTLAGTGFNADNPNRPDTTVAHAQAKMTNAQVSKVDAGSSWLCPGTATVSGAYQLTGANGEQLWATS